jgi:hypothetical protein
MFCDGLVLAEGMHNPGSTPLGIWDRPLVSGGTSGSHPPNRGTKPVFCSAPCVALPASSAWPNGTHPEMLKHFRGWWCLARTALPSARRSEVSRIARAPVRGHGGPLNCRGPGQSTCSAGPSGLSIPLKTMNTPRPRGAPCPSPQEGVRQRCAAPGGRMRSRWPQIDRPRQDKDCRSDSSHDSSLGKPTCRCGQVERRVRPRLPYGRSGRSGHSSPVSCSYTPTPT